MKQFLVAAAAAALLALSSVGPMPARAQASRFSAETVEVDVAQKRVTLKASMGRQTMRVAPGVALDAFKPGDKVLVTFGQDRKESVITSIELVKP